MRRLGAVLLIVLLVAGMNVRSVWSGGGKWGDGSPAGDRTDAYWLPDGQTPTGKPFPDVAIGGTLYTTSLQSASWSLGISDFLADLAPNTASMTFVGQVSGVPGDDVVISTGLGVQWVGRLDTVTQTRDTAGHWWTTVTATDRIGALGAVMLNEQSGIAGGGAADLEGFTEEMADAFGITVDVVDDSVSGLANIVAAYPISGSLLAWVNDHAVESNAMLAMARDGTFHAVVREAVTPASVLTLTGINAPQSWSLSTSIDVDINKWDTVNGSVLATDDADIDQYGERSYSIDFNKFSAHSDAQFDDWIAYGGSQRPVASGTLIVSDYSQDDLILLDPFQWVTEDGTDWQVMSVQHSVSASPYSWTVSITADNLLDLL